MDVRPLKLRTDRARREQAQRTAGYRDGLNGRPAASREAVYQQSYRRGLEARRATWDGNDAA